MNINITNLDISTKTIVNTTIEFLNSPQYDTKNVVYLSTIKMQTWEYNFKDFMIEKMRQ